MPKTKPNTVASMRTLLKEFGIYAGKIWHVNDVHTLCEKNNLPQISHHDAMNVFEHAARQNAGRMPLTTTQIEQTLLNLHTKRNM
jgi:hypothetical protein